MSSYQTDFGNDPYVKAALATHAHFKDLSILAAFLSVYDDIINTPNYSYEEWMQIIESKIVYEKTVCNQGELVRVGLKIVDNLPNGRELQDKERNDFVYMQYCRYMCLAFFLDEWIENLDRKLLANFIIELMVLNQYIAPNRSFEVMSLLNAKYISLKDLSVVLNEVVINNSPVHEIIEQLGVEQVDSSVEVLNIINELILTSSKEVQQYINGNDKILGFFVGKVMKQLTVKTDPAEINRLLRVELDKLKP